MALFVASVLALPLIPRQFFPSSDRPELLVDLSLPQNASIYASEAVAKRLDAALDGDPDVARWSTYVGRGAIRFYLPLNVQLPNDFFTQAVVVAKDVAARERLQSKLEKLLAQDFRTRRVASLRLSLDRRSDGRCSIGSAGPMWSRCAKSRSSSAQIVAANPDAEAGQFRLDGTRSPGAHSRSTRTRRAFSA